MAHIRLENVGLDVPLYVQRHSDVSGWGQVLRRAAFSRPERRLATLLDDISFEAADGDRIAVLGQNGAGKSTLLQILTGAYRPTRGRVQVTGSRQALMNINLGFNGEATVVENVLLRCSSMGIRLAEIRRNVPEILDFAGLESKASHRLKTLSSGQRMRLGFSISTAFQNDVMIMDEWLSTGDAAFLERAGERLTSRVGGAEIVVIATHSIRMARAVCNRAILLEGGQVKAAGSLSRVIGVYRERTRRQNTQIALAKAS
ncbi:ABC transporter ATP-binding protein [Luteimonas sp. Sa2BVA3]|jgi:ABC-type polysaccharide/polyol phosphate transport system ATPase subunit|uniref:ABC transporter ATP-binding protein n=1 Tax=Luteimonas colneyensis TaxID=2762230 RepID=A0ABR8ULH3_9GAMM|nr:ATP-binding cassette domain-containing protein [Luteimonas colneyensis]MBD7988504.1 ABC transporter ATP-binding protein [Luteimonas colneyensis]